MRQGVSLGGRTFASVALALLAFTADALPSAAAELPTNPKCEFIASPGSSKCMLPFPDDYYTKADPTSPTGRRIDFRELAMPTNAAGAPIEAAPYNVGDGFSPGSVITLKFPGIETTADVAATGAAPINGIGRFRATNAPVAVIDASTGVRWPIWVEIDSTVKADKANVEIHPAVNFTSGHRYIVALRNLKNAKKQQLQAPEGFRYFRDNVPSSEERSTNAGRTLKKSFPSCELRASSARACISRGTSRSQATRTTPAESLRCAMPPSRHSATTTSPTAESRAARRRSPSRKWKTNPTPVKSRGA